MYQKWSSKPSILSRVSPGDLYYLFLDITPTCFSKISCKQKHIENRKSENLKIKKPRFTNRSPVNRPVAYPHHTCPNLTPKLTKNPPDNCHKTANHQRTLVHKREIQWNDHARILISKQKNPKKHITQSANSHNTLLSPLPLPPPTKNKHTHEHLPVRPNEDG